MNNNELKQENQVLLKNNKQLWCAVGRTKLLIDAYVCFYGQLSVSVHWVRFCGCG